MICTSCGSALPAEARFCAFCGAARDPAAGKEERKLVTVVFCDLVGSTALSGTLDPETLRWVTLRYFGAMREQIEAYGGTVEKFIGDAVMAVFGVPVIHEDDARRAAAAALGMLAALDRLNADLSDSHGVRLQVRIGVHTGPAVTSTDVSTRQALVSGETVNIAARLEQNAGAGEILIGPVTREAIGPAARTEPVGPLALKGKQRPVTAHRLLSIGTDSPELQRRFDLPFVGRTAELAALDEVLAAVATRHRPATVTVLGEPGIGKTRLVHAWLDRTDRPVRHGWGRCRPYGETGSLTPLADAVRDLVPAGEPVLGAHLLLDGTPGPSGDATYAALARVLDVASRDRPVVLVLDDCQWASDPLLDALDQLTGLARDAALLTVRLARFDVLDRRPWGGDPGAVSLAGPDATLSLAGPDATLSLAGLDATECEMMAATLVEVGAHRAGAPGAMLESTGGNPFYVEQLCAARAESDPGAELPHTLQSLIGARIDALTEAERGTLDLAAIMGREFRPHHLAALAGSGPGPVRDGLTRLCHRRLVEPPAAPDADVFRFSNGLIHEATYRVMAKRVRADHHERAAEVLAGDRAPIATVAGHLEHAYRYRTALGLPDAVTGALRSRTATLLAAAGAQALTRSDLVWADDLLSRAVELFTPGEPGRATTLRQLGEVRIATGRGADGLALLRTALDSPGASVEHAHTRLALAVADTQPAVDAVAGVARAVLPTFEATGDALGQARAHIRIAQHRQFDGRHAEADEHLMLGLRHAVRADAEGERALALGAAGISLWRGPTPVPQAVRRCRELLAEHGGPRPVVRVTLSLPLAVLLALDDREAEALACLAEVRELISDLGYAEGAVVLPLFAAAAQPRSALEHLDAAATAARSLGADGLLVTIAREAARVLLDQGRPAEAAARLSAAGPGKPLLRADAADLDGLLARLSAAEGAQSWAVDLARQAVAAAAQTDSLVLRATAALDQAWVLSGAGRPAEAVLAAERARALFDRKGHHPGVRAAAALVAREDR